MRPTGDTTIDLSIGGFPPGRPLVLTAPDARERTALALALVHHALERGEPVRLLTAAAAPALLHQALSLGFDLEPAIEDGRLGLFELNAGAPALLREHGAGALTDALRADLVAPALVVVDPFTALAAHDAEEAELRDLARDFARALCGYDVALTAEPDRLAAQPALARALSGVAGARFPHADVAADRFASVAAAPARRAKLLVVEDDRLQREMLREWLAADYDVACAGDGFDAFSMLLAERPDLVVLDLVLPRVTGYELLQSMRRAHFDMPVLVASSRVASAGERLGPLVLGATEFIAKPLVRVELLHKVETLLRLPDGVGASRFGGSQPEAEALFGSFSRSRMLESAEFAERIGRACEFGRKNGLSSCLLGLAAGSAAELDHWIEVANRHLRYEDAILRTDKQVAVMLLVATDPRFGPRVLERLAAAAGEPMPAIESQCWLARPGHAEAGAIEVLLEPLRQPGEAAT